MSPETDRVQQSLNLGPRLALAMPVSLFEVPSMYDSPRRVQRKSNSPNAQLTAQVPPPAEASRRRA